MIETVNLTKTFGSFVAVDAVSMVVQPGEIYGLLGPNGAGKTTTLGMILGLIPPTTGEVRIFGRRLKDDLFAIKQQIGVVSEAQAFYDEMTAWEYLCFFGELYHAAHMKQRMQMLLHQVQLWEWRDTLLGEYSTGMRRKLSIVRALLHDPRVLILDEPVANMDPYGIAQIRELLAAQRAAGRAILISSHILSELEQTADRVGIMNGGRLLIEATLPELRRKSRTRRCIEVELVEPVAGLTQALQRMPFVVEVEQHERCLTIYTAPDRDYRAEIGRELVRQGVIVQGMREIEISLEQAFMSITDAVVHDRSAFS